MKSNETKILLMKKNSNIKLMFLFKKSDFHNLYYYFVIKIILLDINALEQNIKNTYEIIWFIL
jgi:hypothetical protein